MARWFYDRNSKLALYLYGPHQHGHRLPHIHVRQNGQELASFNIDGSKLAGDCGKLNNAIIKLIMRNQLHLKDSLELLMQGKEITEVEDSLDD